MCRKMDRKYKSIYLSREYYQGGERISHRVETDGTRTRERHTFA